jgi:hypothetical protein
LTLDYVVYSSFTNVFCWYNGGYGLFVKNGNWGNKFTNCSFYYNGKDGANLVSNSAQTHTGQINATKFDGCKFSVNLGSGIVWAGTTLDFIGNEVELNKATGIRIGSNSSSNSCFAFNIIGNHFESNDSSAIQLVTSTSPYRAIAGGVIEGNYIYGSSTTGDNALITSKYGSGSYPQSLNDVKIGLNTCSKTGSLVVYDLNLASIGNTTTIYKGNYQKDFLLPASTGFTVSDKGYSSASGQYTIITAASGITTSNFSPEILLNAASALTVTANPQIANGYYDGQTLNLTGYATATAVTFNDGNGLRNIGGLPVTLNQGNRATYRWSAGLSLWVQTQGTSLTTPSVNQTFNGTLIDLSNPLYTTYNRITISSNITFTFSSTKINGSTASITIIGDGTHGITITGTDSNGSFNTANGAINQLYFGYDGTNVTVDIVPRIHN